MLSTRDPLQTEGRIQTESEGMEKDIPCKWKYKINWKTRFKMAINAYLSIITLSVNGLNAPIKRR